MSRGAFDVNSLAKTMGPFASYTPQPTFEGWLKWATCLLQGVKSTGLVVEREDLLSRWIEQQREGEVALNRTLQRQLYPGELDTDDELAEKKERRARSDRAIDRMFDNLKVMVPRDDRSWFDPPTRPAASPRKRAVKKAA